VLLFQIKGLRKPARLSLFDFNRSAREAWGKGHDSDWVIFLRATAVPPALHVFRSLPHDLTLSISQSIQRSNRILDIWNVEHFQFACLVQDPDEQPIHFDLRVITTTLGRFWMNPLLFQDVRLVKRILYKFPTDVCVRSLCFMGEFIVANAKTANS
jgi:hypothetical protein